MRLRSMLTACGILAFMATGDAQAEAIQVWPAGASAPQPLAVEPMDGAESLEFRDLSRLAFRYVVFDASGRQLVAFDGSGKLQTSGSQPLWQWELDRIVADGRTFDPDQPLASVLMLTDRRGAVTRSQAKFPAFFAGDELEPGSLLHLFTTWLVAGLSRGFVALPDGDVVPNGEVADPNIYFEGFLVGVSPDAAIVKRLPMAKAIGLAEFAGTDVVVSREQGEIVAERLVGRATMLVDGHSLLDLDTGLPIYTDHKVNFRVERASGEPIVAEMVIRTYLEY
jgi:hypothetical protein